MTVRLDRSCCIACVAAWMISGGSALAQSHRWQFGTAYGYSTGKYGQEETTDFHHFPISAKRYFEAGDLALTVPFVRIVTKGGTRVVSGEVVQVGDGVAADETGLGDMSIKGRYYAVEQHDLWPYIDIAGRLRLPTADESKGLGSGEPDVSLSSEFTRRLKHGGIALAELGYMFTPTSIDELLGNRFLYSMGYGYEPTERTMLSGYVDGRTAASREGVNPLSLLFASEYRMRPDLRLDAMLELGLSDGSPDWGVTIGVRYRTHELPHPWR